MCLDCSSQCLDGQRTGERVRLRCKLSRGLAACERSEQAVTSAGGIWLAPIRAASWQRRWTGDQPAHQGTPASIMESTHINQSDRLEFASFHLKEPSWCCKT